MILESEDEGLFEDGEDDAINSIRQILNNEKDAVGSYILVQFATKRAFKYYVGLVKETF